MNPDETPARGIQVVVEPGPVNGLTVENGMAKLTINTEAGSPTLRITVSPQNVFEMF